MTAVVELAPQSEYALRLGGLLRTLRKSRGWTIGDLTGRLLAEHGVDISRGALQTYEQGTRGIAVRRLHEILAVLGCPVSEFFEQVDEMARPRLSGGRVGVNLAVLAGCRRATLAPARKWAMAQLRSKTGRTTAALEPAAFGQLGVLCGLTYPEIMQALEEEGVIAVQGRSLMDDPDVCPVCGKSAHGQCGDPKR